MLYDREHWEHFLIYLILGGQKFPSVLMQHVLFLVQ